MAIFIALLRGINVGGKDKIQMTDLKRLFEALGLTRVKTYIQSGNAIFESDEPEAVLRPKIEYAIEIAFGFPVVVILRTADELERLIRDCPFSEDEAADAERSNTEGESLYVCLLARVPAQEKIDRLSAFSNDGDEYRIRDRDVYLLLRRSIRNAKLANHLHKLDVPSTVRNWKTMNKLLSLAQSETDTR